MLSTTLRSLTYLVAALSTGLGAYIATGIVFLINFWKFGTGK